MSMLNFKHGLYGNLFNADGSNKVTISNGTIYVTTDEKAMYVDLDGKRIRLSQIVNIPDTKTWQNLTPPYSTEAFYYIVDANALLKYTGEGWVQINSTAELDALIAGLGIYTEAPASPKNGDILVKDGKVSIYDADAEGTKWIDYGTIGSKLLDVSDRVGTLATTVAGHGADITNLKTRATNIETAAAETRKAVGFLGKLDATPATGNLGETVLVGEQVYIWLAEEGETPAGWQPISSLGGRVEELKARIEEVALTAGDQTAVDKLQENLTALANKVNNEETGLAATKAIADKAASDLATYVENHKDDYTNTALDTAIADAKKAGTDAADALDAYKTTNNEAMTALGNRVKALEDAGYVTADGKVKMTGNLDVNSHKVVNVAAPEAGTDAANKTYVDTEVGKANTAASKAQGAADAASQAAAAAGAKGAQGIADAAAALAEAQKKTTMAAVEAKGYATGTELTNAVAAARGVTTETVASVDAKVGGHETRLADLEKGVDDLEKDLLSKVQTADAMIYRGTVANEDELATKSEALGGAHIGDTYKATAEFTMANNTKVNIGDLLIASGTEENGVITAATLAWDHVPSGYVANYNPTLSTVTSATNVVDVNLTSAHAAEGTSGDLGDFQISADAGSAVTVRVSEGNNIAIGMTWGTF